MTMTSLFGIWTFIETLRFDDGIIFRQKSEYKECVQHSKGTVNTNHAVLAKDKSVGNLFSWMQTTLTYALHCVRT